MRKISIIFLWIANQTLVAQSFDLDSARVFHGYNLKETTIDKFEVYEDSILFYEGFNYYGKKKHSYWRLTQIPSFDTVNAASRESGLSLIEHKVGHYKQFLNDTFFIVTELLTGKYQYFVDKIPINNVSNWIYPNGVHSGIYDDFKGLCFLDTNLYIINGDGELYKFYWESVDSIENIGSEDRPLVKYHLKKEGTVGISKRCKYVKQLGSILIDNFGHIYRRSDKLNFRRTGKKLGNFNTMDFIYANSNFVLLESKTKFIIIDTSGIVLYREKYKNYVPFFLSDSVQIIRINESNNNIEYSRRNAWMKAREIKYGYGSDSVTLFLSRSGFLYVVKPPISPN